MTQAPNYFSSCQKFKCSWKLGRIHVGKSTAAKHPHWAMKSYRATPQSKNMKHYKCCSLASSISRNAEKNSAWILTEEIPDVGDCRTVPKHSDSNGVESEHTIPGHVAIIMDGNHRWAKERGLPGIAGHKQGVETLRRTVVYCAKRGIKALTVFAFSTENWRRGPAEISFLLHLVEETLVEKVGELEANGVRLRFIGSMEQISTSLANSMQEAERKTEHNSDLVLTVALNYSGRADIISAGKKIAERVRRGEIKSSEINEETFAKVSALSRPGILSLYHRTQDNAASPIVSCRSRDDT